MFKIVFYFLILDLIVTSEGFDPIPTCSACPQTWAVRYTYKSGETSGCVCAGILSSEGHYGGSCRVSQTTDGVDINARLYIGYCMTQDEGSNITYTGTCPYNNLPFHNNVNVTGEVDLPQNITLLNNFMCNSSIVENNYLTVTVCGQQRRKGKLCGECEDGLGPAVMSYTHPCVECKWYGLLLYLTLSFVPATILCFLIIILRINVLSPPLNAVVFVCQVVTSLVNLSPCSFLFYINMHHASNLILPILILYGLFNMDFFVYAVPPFCISATMPTLTAIALDYIVALYPLALVAIIYFLIEVHDRGFWLFNCLWRPFQRLLARFRKTWDIKGSTISAFATLYVLSFTKIMSTSIGLIQPSTNFGGMCGKDYYNRTHHLYYNASCSMFQPCHRPYVYLTFSIIIIFILFPILYIFLHPCKLLHKCNFPMLRITLLPHEIAKKFHQSFKDGTQEGNIDCRWFAGIYLLIRVVIAASVCFKSTQYLQTLASIIGVLLVAVFQPHTYTMFNCLDSVLFGGLAAIIILWPAGHGQHIAKILIFFIPLLVILVFMGWKLFQKFAVGGKLKLCYYCCYRHFQGTRFRDLWLCIKNGRRSVSAQERRPLLDKANSPGVSCTVVEINN